MFLYLFSTIAVLKHMSLKENKVQFRKKMCELSAYRHVIYPKMFCFTCLNRKQKIKIVSVFDHK